MLKAVRMKKKKTLNTYIPISYLKKNTFTVNDRHLLRETQLWQVCCILTIIPSTRAGYGTINYMGLVSDNHLIPSKCEWND